MSRGSPFRHAQMAGNLDFAMQFSAETPLSSGRIVPKVTVGRVTPFIHLERPKCQTLYCRLFKASRAYISGTAVKQRNQGTPLAIRLTIIARYEEAVACLV